MSIEVILGIFVLVITVVLNLTKKRKKDKPEKPIEPEEPEQPEPEPEINLLLYKEELLKIMAEVPNKEMVVVYPTGNEDKIALYDDIEDMEEFYMSVKDTAGKEFFIGMTDDETYEGLTGMEVEKDGKKCG